LPRGQGKNFQQKYWQILPIFRARLPRTRRKSRKSRILGLAEGRSDLPRLSPKCHNSSAADATRPPWGFPHPAAMPAVSIGARAPRVAHAKSKWIAMEGRSAAVCNKSDAGAPGGGRREGESVCTLRSDTGHQKRGGGRNHRLTHRYPFRSIQGHPPAPGIRAEDRAVNPFVFTKSSTEPPSGTLISAKILLVAYSDRAFGGALTLSMTGVKRA